WVGQERVTIEELCRRLQQAGELTRSGKTAWDRTTVWGMLKNPAYNPTFARFYVDRSDWRSGPTHENE
ncbi:MAG: hypothetical protein DCC55_39420, partial [Chloroflexi bacterium]